MNLTSLRGALIVCFLSLTFQTMMRVGCAESGALLAYFEVQTPNGFD